MKKTLNIFCEIPCLTEESTLFSGIELQKKWFKSADKRLIGQYLQKFINYNLTSFGFLEVVPRIVGIDKNVSLIFSTSKYIGTVPLRSPDSGKQIGDLVITPRYIKKDRYEIYIDILNLLDNEISPEVTNGLPLMSSKIFRPPMYLEASKFIGLMEMLIVQPWRKFSQFEKISHEPVGQINWSKYIANEYKVEKRLLFSINKNILSEFHEEYSQIKYVFDICKNEIMSANTPLRVKLKFKSKLEILDNKLYLHHPLKTNVIAERFSDNPMIRQVKKQANKILNFHLTDGAAWRVDCADVFEKFIQYIFKQVAKELGGVFLANYKLQGNMHYRTSWHLNHLEPDGVLQKDGFLVFVDAKYKSHLYNKFSTGNTLKDEYRHDLHQILSYMSFSQAESKIGVLCYPSLQLEMKEAKYTNNINQVVNSVKVFGVPLQADVIDDVKRLFVDQLSCYL